MKLLVCISKTPDTTTKIAFTNGGSQLNQDGVQFIMNPYDEWYALVRAVELKEQFGGSVTVLNVGPAVNDQIIRKGLAIGADDAVRIDADPSSAFGVAKQIAEYAKAENFDIVFCGKETIDYNGSEIPAMVAEMLDLPFISFATQLNMEGSTAVIEREIEGGSEVLELPTPFVLSAAKGMAEQRIPNMKGIMTSKSKPLKVVPAFAAEDLSVPVMYELPNENTVCKYVDPENMDELVRLLHEEAKVI